MVSKLNLPTVPHPQPYTLHWLEKGNEVHVSRQALVSYSIVGFKDEVLCEVLPMDTCHLLLGRPWQFDKETTHHGRSNTYSFGDKGQSFVLTPLLFSQEQPNGVRNTSGRSPFMSKVRRRRKDNHTKDLQSPLPIIMWDPGTCVRRTVKRPWDLRENPFQEGEFDAWENPLQYPMVNQGLESLEQEALISLNQ